MSATTQPVVPFEVGGVVPIARQRIAASTRITPIVWTLPTPVPLNVRISLWFCIYGVTQLNLGTIVYVEGSSDASGDDGWFPVYKWTSQPHTTANLASQALTGTGPSAGATSFTVGSQGVFANDDLCLLYDGVGYSAPNAPNSEWVTLKSAGTTMTVVNGLVYPHAITTTTLYRGAEYASKVIDTSNILRLRFHASNGLQTVSDTVVEVKCTACGGFG